MSNSNYNIPQTAIKFSNTVFILGILFFILIMIYSAYRIFNPIYVNNTGDTEITFFYICICIREIIKKCIQIKKTIKFASHWYLSSVGRAMD